MKLTAEEPLLEREAELSALERLISDVQGGSGRLALIEGEAGIGKTRLLGAAAERARERGFTVLFARGGERERDFAFGIVRQLLEPLLRAAAPADREQLMAGAASFSEAVFAEPAADAQRSGDPSYAVLHGLYWLVANLAERAPTVLAVDDAHWADRPSLRFVGFLARRLEGMGVLVALASRRGEPGAEADLLRALWQELGTRPIEPRPLSEEALARVVRSRLGEASTDELCAACHEATRGNPFLLSEALIELTESAASSLGGPAVTRLAPRSVAAAVLARLERLPQAAPALAWAVAILGERAALSHAAPLAGLEPEKAGSAADLLAAAAILAPERPLRFVHPIVRSAIYDDMAQAERARAHARAARLLAAEAAEPDAIAVHLLASEPAADAWVVETLRAGARGALAQGAPEVASRYLRRALAEPPEERAEVLVELGSAEARAGEPAAREHLAAARKLATDPWPEVQATIELTLVLSYEGEMAEATTIALQTLEAMRDRPDAAKPMKIALLALAQTDLSARRMTGGIVRQANRAVERLGASAPRNVLAMIAFERALVDGTAKEVATLAEAALADGRLIEEVTADSPQSHIASIALTLAGRGELAERELSAALADALQRGSARGFGLVSAIRAWSRYRTGALAGAEADARAFLELASDPVRDLCQPMALSALVDVLIERGGLSAARAALAQCGVGPHTPETAPAQPLRESRARLRMAEGKPREALAELAAYARWEADWGALNGIFVQWRSAAAIAHAALGESEQAHRLADEELRLTRRFGAPHAIGIALRAAAIIERQAQGIELLREAVELLERSDARLEHARALTELGGALRRANRRADAREPLRQALELAQHCGASVLAQRALDELKATGARPRSLLRSGIDALTPTERRISAMAAQGLSNPEIAQNLFLARKTVENHLGNAYQKLDIQSRDELPRVLSDAAA